MQECTLQIKNQLGFHARATTLFVQLVNKYHSNVKVFKDDQEVDGKSIMGLLTLAAECGSLLRIVIEGPDELDALKDITNLIENKFYEK